MRLTLLALGLKDCALFWAEAGIPWSEAESPKASSMRGANPSRRIGRGASPRRPLSHDCRDFVRTVISFFAL